MGKETMIRHRRLYAFYQSKVLNVLMIVTVCWLFVMYYTHDMVLPVVCGSLSMLLFVGYSLWLWLCKPKSIVVNKFLSEYDSFLILYFLIIGVVPSPSGWLLILPIATSIVALFTSMAKSSDTTFHIPNK